MKKSITLILSILLVLILVACHNKPETIRRTKKELIGRMITYDDFLAECLNALLPGLI